MTTHKPVTEADIAAALRAGEPGAQAINMFADPHDDPDADDVAARIFAALPEPEPTAREDATLGLAETVKLPKDHPGVWLCRCGAGWIGEARCYPDDLRSHAIFRTEGGEPGADHDPGLARFRPDRLATSSRPAAPELRAALDDWQADYDGGWGDEFASGQDSNGGFSLTDHGYEHAAKSFRLVRAARAFLDTAPSRSRD